MYSYFEHQWWRLRKLRQVHVQSMMLQCVLFALKSLKHRGISHVNIRFATIVYILTLSVNPNLRNLVWDSIVQFVVCISQVLGILENQRNGRTVSRWMSFYRKWLIDQEIVWESAILLHTEDCWLIFTKSSLILDHEGRAVLSLT